MFRFLFFILLLLSVACTPGITRSPEELVQAKNMIDLGVLHLRNEDLKAAQSAFELSYEIRSSSAALDGLGSIAFRKKDYKKAEHYFIRAWMQDENYYQALVNLALLYELTNNAKYAEKLYKILKKNNPTNFKFRNNFAAFLFDNTNMRDKNIKSLNEFFKAYDLNPNSVVRTNIERLKNK